MHPLHNGSQVTARPARKTTSGTMGYFSESNDSNAPSYPGADFFNDQIDEFKNALAVMGIAYDETKVDHLARLFISVSKSVPVYSATTVYTYGDIVQKTIGGVKKFFQWYSNVESLAGKDPELDANRRTGWSDDTKPFYWLPYSPKVAGETIYWDTDTTPENMVLGIGQQLPVAVYHTLAAAKPEWVDGVDNTLLNIPDRQGRFTRAANGTTWLAGETHEDAIRNLTGVVGSSVAINGAPNPAGVFQSAGIGSFQYQGGGSTSLTVDFDASRVVPTANENQPKSFIEWVGYSL
ncbi:TPA: hypothetical protein SD634_003401 [Vibrio cholerae]|nr:hypothetical protein [Vibrio cholerae]